MASYLENQIKDWHNRGIIADDVAAALLADIGRSAAAARDGDAKPFSFFRIVAIFAAISFAAAIVMFISANWEAIPRLAKVAGIMVLIAGGLIGGAVIGARGGRHARPGGGPMTKRNVLTSAFVLAVVALGLTTRPWVSGTVVDTITGTTKATVKGSTAAPTVG